MNLNTMTLTEAEMAPIVAARIETLRANLNPLIAGKMAADGYEVRFYPNGLGLEFVLSVPRPYDRRVRTVSYRAGTFIGGCKGCKRPLRSEGAVDFATSMNVHGACPCGQWVTVHPLKGKVTEHKCGARCRASTGPNCDCSCGGANHGCG